MGVPCYNNKCHRDFPTTRVPMACLTWLLKAPLFMLKVSQRRPSEPLEELQCTVALSNNCLFSSLIIGIWYVPPHMLNHSETLSILKLWEAGTIWQLCRAELWPHTTSTHIEWQTQESCITSADQTAIFFSKHSRKYGGRPPEIQVSHSVF